MHDSFFDSLVEAVASFLLGGADPALLSESVITPDSQTLNRRHLASRDYGPVGLARIREHDPKFDIAEFLKHVGEMFFAYHLAQDEGDLSPARRFIDEESWAQLNQMVTKSGRRAEGPRTFRINAIRPMTATHEFELDTIRVLINAQITNDDDPPLCEYWELIRKEGALTQSGLDLVHCPNCGAPITGDDPTRCAYCGERLADPAFDWVARKIAIQ